MADGYKQIWSFNEGILHCRNRDMGTWKIMEVSEFGGLWGMM